MKLRVTVKTVEDHEHTLRVKGEGVFGSEDGMSSIAFVVKKTEGMGATYYVGRELDVEIKPL